MTWQVITSREFKVAGAIGCCMSLNKKSQSVAEQVFPSKYGTDKTVKARF